MEREKAWAEGRETESRCAPTDRRGEERPFDYGCIFPLGSAAPFIPLGFFFWLLFLGRARQGGRPWGRGGQGLGQGLGDPGGYEAGVPCTPHKGVIPG